MGKFSDYPRPSGSLDFRLANIVFRSLLAVENAIAADDGYEWARIRRTVQAGIPTLPEDLSG